MWHLEAPIVATNHTIDTTSCLPYGEHVVANANINDPCCREHNLVKCICMEPLNICLVSNVTKFDLFPDPHGSFQCGSQGKIFQ